MNTPTWSCAVPGLMSSSSSGYTASPGGVLSPGWTDGSTWHRCWPPQTSWCCPSLVFETQGMVVIEAMSCGTPAVASAIGGIPETLAAFPDHLVPPGDAVALATALDRLVGWRRHSPALGADSRRWVVDNLALGRTVGTVSSLLAEVGR